jgi:hypothetical protein
MPKYICKICKQSISYPEIDRQLHEDHSWECLSCFTIIASGRYDINVPGARTIFSPMGSAIGDRIVQEVVRRYYSDNNPNENIFYLDGYGPTEEILRNGNINKIFWADVTNFMPMPKGAMWFSLTNEADALARKGLYPQLPFALKKPNIELENEYVVLHVRNIKKTPSKNAEPLIIKSVVDFFKRINKKVVLVGNDRPLEGEDMPNVIDLRFSLQLSEIAWIIKGANLFVGKDSGVAHLAGCCKVSMVCWGYKSKRWTPKVPSGQGSFLMDAESNDINVLNLISNKMMVAA